jgi:hypothetical protein
MVNVQWFDLNRARVFSQNTEGIPGTKESGDGFGSF